MKKLINRVIKQMMSYISLAAFILAVSSVNNACFFWSYQPKLPDALKKYEM